MVQSVPSYNSRALWLFLGFLSSNDTVYSELHEDAENDHQVAEGVDVGVVVDLGWLQVHLDDVALSISLHPGCTKAQTYTVQLHT